MTARSIQTEGHSLCADVAVEVRDGRVYLDAPAMAGEDAEGRDPRFTPPKFPGGRFSFDLRDLAPTLAEPDVWVLDPTADPENPARVRVGWKEKSLSDKYPILDDVAEPVRIYGRFFRSEGHGCYFQTRRVEWPGERYTAGGAGLISLREEQ